MITSGSLTAMVQEAFRGLRYSPREFAGDMKGIMECGTGDDGPPPASRSGDNLFKFFATDEGLRKATSFFLAKHKGDVALGVANLFLCDAIGAILTSRKDELARRGLLTLRPRCMIVSTVLLEGLIRAERCVDDASCWIDDTQVSRVIESTRPCRGLY